MQAVHSTSDAVFNAILKFIKVLLNVVGQFSDYVATLSSAIPSSLYVLRKGMSDQTTFTKLVVCPTVTNCTVSLIVLTILEDGRAAKNVLCLLS